MITERDKFVPWFWWQARNLVFVDASSSPRSVTGGTTQVFFEEGGRRQFVHEFPHGRTTSLVRVPESDDFTLVLVCGGVEIERRRFRVDAAISLEENGGSQINGSWAGASGAFVVVYDWAEKYPNATVYPVEAAGVKAKQFLWPKTVQGSGGSWKEILVFPVADDEAYGPCVQTWMAPTSRTVEVEFRLLGNWDKGTDYLEVQLTLADGESFEVPEVWVVIRERSGSESLRKVVWHGAKCRFTSGNALGWEPQLDEEITLVARSDVHFVSSVIQPDGRKDVRWDGTVVNYGPGVLRRSKYPVKFQPPALSDRMEGFLRECNIKPNRVGSKARALLVRRPGIAVWISHSWLQGILENETAVSAIYDIPLPVLLGFLEAFENIVERVLVTDSEVDVDEVLEQLNVDELLESYLEVPDQVECVFWNPQLLTIIDSLGMPSQRPCTLATVIGQAVKGDPKIQARLAAAGHEELQLWLEAVADNLDLGGVLDLLAERRIKVEVGSLRDVLVAADFLEHSGFDDVELRFVAGTTLHRLAQELSEARRVALDGGAGKDVLEVEKKARKLCTEVAKHVGELKKNRSNFGEDWLPLVSLTTQDVENPGVLVALRGIEQTLSKNGDELLGGDKAFPGDIQLRADAILWRRLLIRAKTVLKGIDDAVEAFLYAVTSSDSNSPETSTLEDVLADLKEAKTQQPSNGVLALVTKLNLEKELDCKLKQFGKLEAQVDKVVADVAELPGNVAIPVKLETLQACIGALSEARDAVALRLIEDKVWDSLVADLAEYREVIGCFSIPARELIADKFSQYETRVADPLATLEDTAVVRADLDSFINVLKTAETEWLDAVARIPDSLRRRLELNPGRQTIDIMAGLVQTKAGQIDEELTSALYECDRTIEELLTYCERFGGHTALVEMKQRLLSPSFRTSGGRSDRNPGDIVFYPEPLGLLFELSKLEQRLAVANGDVCALHAGVTHHAKEAIKQKCREIADVSGVARSVLFELVDAKSWVVLLAALQDVSRVSSVLEVRRRLLCEDMEPPTMLQVLWLDGDNQLARALYDIDRLTRDIPTLVNDPAKLEEVEEALHKAEQEKGSQDWFELRNRLGRELTNRVFKLGMDPSSKRLDAWRPPKSRGNPFHEALTWTSRALLTVGVESFGQGGPRIDGQPFDNINPEAVELLKELLRRYKLI
ncbi:MAG TPA: hypothetical protein PLN07_04410 [Myxococcota bacterium]|nr:hypothetical protein [Myxococcota bacterium]